MNKYETLISEAEKEGIECIEWPFESDRIKGLAMGNVAAVSTKCKTAAEKRCILAEELGHLKTGSGTIIDQSKENNIRQEAKARSYAYSCLISLDDIRRAVEERGCRNRYEIAEELDVTEEFLNEAILVLMSKENNHKNKRSAKDE